MTAIASTATTAPAATTAVRDTSPRTVARLTGAFYLFTIALGVYAQAIIADRLVVSGNAATTAANILAHEPLFRFGFTVFLVEMACQVVMTALFYELLKPVNKRVSALSAAFSYIGIGIKTLARLFYVAPLLVLVGANLGPFSVEQREALALLFLRVNNQAAGIALVFFGFSTVLQGYLILKSSFLPRALGWLAVIGGLGWLAFLSPPVGNRAFVGIALFALVGSLAMIVWLLTVGVNEERWTEQARAAAGSIWW
jgi:hypothetical protein